MAVKEAIEEVKDTAQEVGHRVAETVSKWMPWNWGKKPATPQKLVRSQKQAGDLMSLRHEFESLFDRMQQNLLALSEAWPFGSEDLWDRMPSGSVWPHIEVDETDKAFRVRAELPGLSGDDVDISLDGNTLVIAGERKEEHESDRRGIYRRETYYGSFYRRISLPDEVDPDKVSAKFRRGVLTVTLPKLRESDQAMKRIEIK